MALLQPKEHTVTDLDGKEHVFTLSKFPAVAGREIVAKYPLSSMPKLGDYEVNEATMLKLMGFVAKNIGGNEIALKTRGLIDNHVPDWETLAKIEFAMMDYNTSFFRNGKALGFLKGSVRTFLQSVLPMLKPLLEQSLAAVRPPSKS